MTKALILYSRTIIFLSMQCVKSSILVNVLKFIDLKHSFKQAFRQLCQLNRTSSNKSEGTMSSNIQNLNLGGSTGSQGTHVPQTHPNIFSLNFVQIISIYMAKSMVVNFSYISIILTACVNTNGRSGARQNREWNTKCPFKLNFWIHPDQSTSGVNP